ncbi:S-formylglutathione hydrolase-like [Oncorhynchus keta]|uniref:S-formylglutathione hydrolase-like n=1 Tax=Oncorhynchus keta TaxID=8018 RepID=UPI0015FBD8A3|nr:S-formylglutathione hydrolase-like [Oncorhynchus keta]
MALTQVATRSTELKCQINLAIYLPPKTENGKCPVLYWLSGGCNIEGKDESWDFGTGFYVNATQESWKSNYRMYAYVRVCVSCLPPSATPARRPSMGTWEKTRKPGRRMMSRCLQRPTPALSWTS